MLSVGRHQNGLPALTFHNSRFDLTSERSSPALC